MSFERTTHKVARGFFIATNLIPLFDPESWGGKPSALGELSAYHSTRQLPPQDFVLSGANRGMMSRLSNSELKLRNEMFAQGMLWCTRCKQFHPVKDFRKYRPKARPNHTNYGYRLYCLRCEKLQNIDRKDTQSLFFKERNAALKAKFVDLAGGRCQRCGYNDFIAALDFHHVYPALKKYEPTYIIYSGNFEKAWRELDTCCLLCRNCHIIYKARMWQAEFIKRPGLGYTIGADLPLDDKRYETDKPPKLQQAPLPLFTQRQNSVQQLGLF